MVARDCKNLTPTPRLEPAKNYLKVRDVTTELQTPIKNHGYFSAIIVRLYISCVIKLKTL